jgi:hypothetical protein
MMANVAGLPAFLKTSPGFSSTTSRAGLINTWNFAEVLAGKLQSHG